jgi:hypothetical protein
MNKKNLITVLQDDRELLAIFSGIILTGVAMLSVLVTAGIWYL